MEKVRFGIIGIGNIGTVHALFTGGYGQRRVPDGGLR